MQLNANLVPVDPDKSDAEVVAFHPQSPLASTGDDENLFCSFRYPPDMLVTVVATTTTTFTATEAIDGALKTIGYAMPNPRTKTTEFSRQVTIHVLSSENLAQEAAESVAEREIDMACQRGMAGQTHETEVRISQGLQEHQAKWWESKLIDWDDVQELAGAGA